MTLNSPVSLLRSLGFFLVNEIRDCWGVCSAHKVVNVAGQPCLAAVSPPHFGMFCPWSALLPARDWHKTPCINCLRDFRPELFGLRPEQLEEKSYYWRLHSAVSRKGPFALIVGSVGRLFISRITNPVSQLRSTVGVEDSCLLLQPCVYSGLGWASLGKSF